MPDVAIWTDPATGIAAVTGLSKSAERRGASLADVMPKVTAEAWQVVDRASLPDKAFRNAWRVQGGGIVEDLPAARVLAKRDNPGLSEAIDSAPNIQALRTLLGI